MARRSVSRDPLKNLRVVSLWYRTETRRQARSSGRDTSTNQRGGMYQGIFRESSVISVYNLSL